MAHGTGPGAGPRCRPSSTVGAYPRSPSTYPATVRRPCPSPTSWADAAHVADVVARAACPVVLVGHSLRRCRDRRGRRAGGCSGPRVRRRFLPGQRRVRRAPDRRQLPAHPCRRRHRAHGGAPDHRSGPGDDLLLRPVPGPAAEAAIARMCPQPVATFVQPATVVAWHDRPSTYVLCSRDNAIHPLHQAAMAERCDEVVTLDTDHSPFTSATTAVVDVIERVAGPARPRRREGPHRLRPGRADQAQRRGLRRRRGRPRGAAVRQPVALRAHRRRGARPCGRHGLRGRGAPTG